MDPGEARPVVVRSVYVHAPFCARRCFYCDFAVTVNRHGGWEAWAGALRQEVALWEEAGAALQGTADPEALPVSMGPPEPPAVLASRLETVFVGGGTPSLLGPGAMAGLTEVLGPDRLDHPELEWTAEANPESLTPELASAWRAAGLNRLSLGVQSFQAPALRWMGRLHGVDGARNAVRVAREEGIHNLSVDLIFGLPAALERDWRADLETALSLNVPHISLYGLTSEAGTPLARQVAEGRVHMADDRRYEEEYLSAHELLTAEGYGHYEVSNFARPGFESRHNRACWDGLPYLGLGNSAHSYLPPIRRWNRRDWADYLRMLGANEAPVAERERLGPAELELERIWLGLRTDRGLELATLGPEDRNRIRTAWLPRGLARVRDGIVRLTARGWLLLDDLAVQLKGRPAPDGHGADPTGFRPRPGPGTPPSSLSLPAAPG